MKQKLFFGKDLKEVGARCDENLIVHVESIKNDVNGNRQYLVSLFFEGEMVYKPLTKKGRKDCKYKLQDTSNTILNSVVWLLNEIAEQDNQMLNYV